MVTVKFNGKVIAERTTMQVGVASSWESVARTRLEAVLPPETVADYMGAGLKVHLFESAAHLPSQRVAAQISDPVSGGFTLGYAHVVLAFEALQYGLIRPPPRVDAAARMMGTAQWQAATLDLPKPYARSQRKTAACSTLSCACTMQFGSSAQSRVLVSRRATLRAVTSFCSAHATLSG